MEKNRNQKKVDDEEVDIDLSDEFRLDKDDWIGRKHPGFAGDNQVAGEKGSTYQRSGGMLLPERLRLLATKAEKGTVPMSIASRVNLGLAGSVLMELALREKVKLGKKSKLTVIDSEPTGVDYLDTALRQIAHAGKERKAKYWVQKLGGNLLLDQVSSKLVTDGVLQDDSYRWLGLIKVRQYPIVQIEDVMSLKKDVREAVFTENIDDIEDHRRLMLLGLLNTCQLTPKLFSRDERKEAKKRIKTIMESDALAKSVSEAAQAVEAAVMGATAGAVAASSASS
ncbi:hypothetical protein ABID56_000968 [Alkalibacillus flavidus]|uniref:GPP34 family phosphoprotein n=1 Tax=Alkalibacillus flavidus TaxID=546021 RepID=A0ABV2KTG9_9BACI